VLEPPKLPGWRAISDDAVVIANAGTDELTKLSAMLPSACSGALPT
jgi:hypothetical protein